MDPTLQPDLNRYDFSAGVGTFGAACNLIRSAINGSVVAYALKLYLYLFVAGVVGFLAARWLSPLGLFVNLICAFPAAYLTILIGRRILNKPNGL
jgi:hypothetical protein